MKLHMLNDFILVEDSDGSDAGGLVSIGGSEKHVKRATVVHITKNKYIPELKVGVVVYYKVLKRQRKHNSLTVIDESDIVMVETDE